MGRDFAASMGVSSTDLLLDGLAMINGINRQTEYLKDSLKFQVSENVWVLFPTLWNTRYLMYLKLPSVPVHIAQ